MDAQFEITSKIVRLPPAELGSYHHHVDLDSFTWLSMLSMSEDRWCWSNYANQMLLCDNCNGGYHLFCLKLELIEVPIDIWYDSSCFLTTPWFLLSPCHTFPNSGLVGGYMKISSQPPLVHYICMCVHSFWLISFYLWLVLVFLFSRVYYGFTPLRHRTSRHYTSQHCINDIQFAKGSHSLYIFMEHVK
jgi:hypothetical protein